MFTVYKNDERLIQKTTREEALNAVLFHVYRTHMYVCPLIEINGDTVKINGQIVFTIKQTS